MMTVSNNCVCLKLMNSDPLTKPPGLLRTENIILFFKASVSSLTLTSYFCDYTVTSGHGQRRDECL